MSRRRRSQGPDGLFLIDKPLGVSSFDVIRALRRITRIRKLGHAGTLDPLASGVLPVLANRATRLVPFLMGGRKTYVARVRLGVETDSGDAEGEIIAEREVPGELTEAQIRHVCRDFVGQIEQVPPAHSAIRVDGKRAYELARAGEEVNLPARTVDVGSIEVSGFDGQCFEMIVECGKGTYIRSLARDIGAALETGGSLVGLRRSQVGGLSVGNATPLSELDVEGADWAERVITMFDALDGLARDLELSDDERNDLLHGRVGFIREDALEADLYRVAGTDGALLAVIDARESTAKPSLRVFPPKPPTHT